MFSTLCSNLNHPNPPSRIAHDGGGGDDDGGEAVDAGGVRGTNVHLHHRLRCENRNCRFCVAHAGMHTPQNPQHCLQIVGRSLPVGAVDKLQQFHNHCYTHHAVP